MTLQDRIRQRLDDLKLSAREASKRSGMGEYFVRDILSGKAVSPKESSLRGLAIALETTTEWLMEQRGSAERDVVPVRCFVGAGALVTPFDDQEALEYVDAPPGAAEIAGAAIVRGDSQIPVLNPGDVVFWGNGSGSPADYIGIECVVTLGDGSQMVKTVLPGSTTDRFTLTSHNALPIVDAAVTQALPVLWVRRRLPK